MSEHTSIAGPHQPAQAAPSRGSNQPRNAAASPIAGRCPPPIRAIIDSLRDRRRSKTKPHSANERAGSLKYEHVHRIEITISLLAGIAGRVPKQ
jgi:hypothetical protein